MKISGPWMQAAPTQAVCAALTGAGFRALFVGGCVRNALLGLAVADIDIATDAVPETVTNLAENAGFKVVPTGIDHGTVTVIAAGIAHEITTFRRDIETHGRHATVAFSTDIADDATRRDLTMNALYATPDGEVVDPMGGLADLMARQVRFVGDANARITEDYLRILRFFRFHAIYGDPNGGIDAEGLAACAANSAGIETLSCERITAEMRKLLSADNPGPAVAAMARSGVLNAVLPGADDRALAPLVHLEGDTPPHWLRRLAVLGGLAQTAHLRFSRAETTTFGHIRDEIATLKPASELGYRLGVALAKDVILARAALFETPPPNAWQDDAIRGAAAKFPLRAADLMPALHGPALGDRLRVLEQAWIDSGFSLTRAQLLA
ncbi:CCA tRNA nucleotidyltransferase [Rhodobacter ferrooxidans]|uniref:Polynucleotide adenylyltransferase region n=1 Tax=Rhodobacter ferrooxidans TaxID=371731 RepID=C8S253_9RHOB|nr:CCA tRNA nucleotidyltransferase [Rhodobacter sp. SW2]EEW24925.1 Polynucleotide adenylyltransferase region [Rhodobacter sp. SW2]